MKSWTTLRFRAAYQALPAPVRQQARAAYRLFRQNPQHPSLRFKQVHASRPIYAMRIGLDYRVLGVRTSSAIIWFWIGRHADYDQLLDQL